MHIQNQKHLTCINDYISNTYKNVSANKKGHTKVYVHFKRKT